MTDKSMTLDHSTLVDPRQTFASKLKSSVLWKIFVVSAVPLFNFFWAYILHFKERLLYLTSPYSGKGSQTLNQLSVEIVKNDPDYLTFAKWLLPRIPTTLIGKTRERLLHDKNEGMFVATIENSLDEDTRFELLKYALSDKVLSQVLPYFKIVPRIDTIFVTLNIPKPEEIVPEGSQRWHRDGDIYKMISTYICLTDLDQDSGRFTAVSEKYLKYHQAIPIESYDNTKSIWKNGRHSDSYFAKYISEKEQTHFEGPMGTAAFVDSATCYHKGGHCKKRERLLFSINFISDQTHDSKSIIDKLNLRNHPRLQELLDTPLKRTLVKANSVKRGHLVFALARRLLTYYIPQRY